MAAVVAGARHVQGTLNGLGERTGNCNLTTIIPNLQLKLGMQCLPDGHLDRLTSVSNHIAEVLNRPLNPPEVCPVDKPWMRPNRDPVLASQRDRGPHRRLIPRVPTAGDIGRGNERHHGRIMRAPFAQIAVKIDSHHLRSFLSAIPCRNHPIARSRTTSAASATSSVTGRNRTRAPGRNCAALDKSAAMT